MIVDKITINYLPERSSRICANACMPSEYANDTIVKVIEFAVSCFHPVNNATNDNDVL